MRLIPSLALLSLSVAAFGAPAHDEVVSLVLPADLPGTFQVSLDMGGGRTTLALQRHSLRAPDFQLRVQGDDGTIRAVEAPEPATYRGYVVGEPGSAVAASLTPDGLTAAVFGALGDWYLEPTDNARGEHSIEHGSSFEGGVCGTDELLFAAGAEVAHSAGQTSGTWSGLDCQQVAQIAFDVDFDYYTNVGSSVPTVIADVEAVMNAVDLIYVRDTQLTYVLTDTIVRTAEPDPYSSLIPGELLSAFRTEWNNNQGAITRDLAHFVTGREMDTNVIGLAWVGVMCGSYAYGLSQYTGSFSSRVTITGHEIGHNWSAPHCLDPSCVIMCGGCHQIGDLSAKRMRNHADNASCIDPAPGGPTAVPPNALNDEYLAAGTALYDVLENDYDGNCDPVSIVSWDIFTLAGGSLGISLGTGPGGRDQLSYTAPAGQEGASDSFTYTITDGGGFDSAVVNLADTRLDLVAHYKLDETSGGTMLDSSVNARHGTYVDGPLLGQSGAAAGTGTSVDFDGVLARGHVSGAPALNELRSHVAVSAWVNLSAPGGNQRIFEVDNSWSFGINGSSSLRFTTVGILDYDLNVGSLPTGTWMHVAAVFDESYDVTFYVDGANVGTVGGSSPAGNGADWNVGSWNGDSQFFNGRIDDIQVYDQILNAAQIQFMYENPGVNVAECGPATSYCIAAPNSVGGGMFLSLSGSQSMATNGMTLTAQTGPFSQFGIFFYGQNQIQAPFGDGFRCAGGTTARINPPVLTDFFGVAAVALDVTSPPFTVGAGTVTPGESWNFQFWYRDPTGGPSGFNLSDGLCVTFLP
jgi:hypothetical protein